MTDATSAPVVTDGELVVCSRCAVTHFADCARASGYPLNAELAGTDWVCQDPDACARRAAALPSGDELARLVAIAWEHVMAARLRETGDQVLVLQHHQEAAVQKRDEAIRAAASVGIPRQRIAEWSGADQREVVELTGSAQPRPSRSAKS